MKRREFITLIGGAAGAAIDQGADHWLPERVLDDSGQWVAALVQRLREPGWIEGRACLVWPHSLGSRK